jgi:hypothetical protein
MSKWITQIFAGSPVSDLWAALVLLGILVAIVAITSRVGERPIANLTHSILVALKYSTDSLGQRNAKLTQQMMLYRLRSMKHKTLNEAAFRKAQAVTVNAKQDSFEVKVIGEALGLWVATAFRSISSASKRKILLEDIARLLRTPEEQAAPAPSPARTPQKKTATPPTETESPGQISNVD